MKSRLEDIKSAAGPRKAMLGLELYLAKCGLDSHLLDLVRFRVSQLNGCAYCIDMHSKDLRANGESEQRLYALDAWRETPFFNEREQAALAWAEAVTLLEKKNVPDDVYTQARKEFNEKELTDLTLAIVAINGWNRFNIAFRTVPGNYQAGQLEKMLESAAG